MFLKKDSPSITQIDDKWMGISVKIWIFNNYNMLPEQGGLNRHYYFGKYLKLMGHDPMVFVGSHPHNTNLQMIPGKERFLIDSSVRFPWVYVRTCNYENSKLKRVYSMFEYYWNAKKAATQFESPSVILGSSAHPLAAVLSIRLGKKYGCKSVVEVRDLWPESIIAYGIAGAHNPAVIALRWLEKWIYKKADAVVFTMEGAYDYIVEQGWEKDIPRSKVHYINNGVDLELFRYNREHYRVEDADLDCPEIFKVVYTGSIRHVNNLGLLLDAAKNVSDPRVKFLIWGDGDERDALEQRVKDEGISNVVFKGRVEKKYIPSIVSRADLNLAHNTPTPLFRFGISLNKMFDYMAAGKPILSDFACNYNPAVQCGAGVEVVDATSKSIAQAIEHMAQLPPDEYERFCAAASRTAEEYDFANLTKKLLGVLE